MKVVIVCSDKNHPVNIYLEEWSKQLDSSYIVEIVSSIKDDFPDGDILFLISCNEIVGKEVRDRFSFTLVLHASDLPTGRGWSPHIWDILAGKKELTLSLLNAEDGVDTGDIWKKVKIHLDGSELYDEINHKLFSAETELMTWACENVYTSVAKAQDEKEVSYHKKRAPADSELNVNDSILSQFNLLRTCDPKRFPAFFYVNGVRYNIHLEKVND